MTGAVLVSVVVFLPLASSILVLLFNRRLPRSGDFLSLGAVGLSWLASMTIFLRVFIQGEALSGWAVDWAVAGEKVWRLGFTPDPLGVAMLLVVPTVSLLVHIYSTGYMHGHERYGRFFAFITFFTFAMLALVLSDNILFFFVAWELMGLCSYLLIGFYFEERAAQLASMKAFLTTRIGDVGLFLGISVFYAYTGELTFAGIYHAGPSMPAGALLLASLLVLSGAIGKSAQFPLHVWLPDAMEGPSPVSALIHAATMVAAGIFLVARMAPVFPPAALHATAWTGAFTAFFAATMALVSRDFKKVLAYSTISQLGYMLAGIGVGSTVAGMYHLTTHAFFKALLFLGSGAVLHAVHSRSLDDMGGLGRRMPWTCGTMYVGSFALAGFPYLFSGFYSKDEILGVALAGGLAHGGLAQGPFLLLAAAAGLTAFYTFRMMILAFHGEPRDHHKFEHAHEQPLSMVGPLILLAVASTFLLPMALGSTFHARFETVAAPGSALAARVAEASHAAAAPAGHGEAAHHAHQIAMWISIALAFGGIALAYVVYYWKKIPADILMRNPLGKGAYETFLHLYWIDEAYLWLVARVVDLANFLGRFDRVVIDFLVDMWGPISIFAGRVIDLCDRYFVDFLVNALADMTRALGDAGRRLMTGRAPDEILGWSAGFAALVWVALRWTVW